MSFIVIFVTKSIFLVLLPNISNGKKALKLRHVIPKHVNDFSVTTLLTKAYRQKLNIQKLCFSPQSQTGSKYFNA
jgi:hypothetical protein